MSSRPYKNKNAVTRKIGTYLRSRYFYFINVHEILKKHLANRKSKKSTLAFSFSCKLISDLLGQIEI